MRGADGRSGSLFSHVDLEARVWSGRPLRTIREIANAALSGLPKSFTALVGLGIDDPVWDYSTFSRNHDWLLEGEIAATRALAAYNLVRLPKLLTAPA